MDKTNRCHVEYPISKWCSLLGLKQKKLVLFLELTEKELKTKVVSCENKIRIEIPNLLKKRDNYTKDLEETSEKLPSKDLDLEVDKEKTISKPMKRDKKEPKGFERFWSIYPKKKSKGAARKAWIKINPDATLQDRIIKKVEEGVGSKEWSDKEFIPYPASWLNAEGWEDEFTYVKGKTESQKKEEQIKLLRKAILTKKDGEDNKLTPGELKKAEELLKEYEGKK